MAQTFLDDKVNEVTEENLKTSPKSGQQPIQQSVKKVSTLTNQSSSIETSSSKVTNESAGQTKEKSKFLRRKKQTLQRKNPATNTKTPNSSDSLDESLTPVNINGDSTTPSDEIPEVSTKGASTNTKSDKELKQITKERQKNTQKTIDAINFIQPSLELTKEEQQQVDIALTRAEQEQLTILWRATLERNKTIRFIVEKLTPESKDKKKNQILSQVLNTAIFLPFYALQSVAPTDTSALASYVGAGLAGDIINGRATKNNDKMQLSQTEMVIMFMMIDQVAERVRTQFHSYKQERIDEILALNELEESKLEAAASLDTARPESRFLSQVRIRQVERELRRITLRARSNRIVLVDLSGPEAVDQVDKLMQKEIKAVIDLPSIVSVNNK
ncbi:MAG: hypothetical protein SFU25_04700 [Candidatus Caenarcaniphilales bacterium]|nr:hypothetical protein [Candidatus Caenarcaniphilales bacterium]